MQDVPKIILAGQSYPVPKMAVKQLRVLLPKALKLMSSLGPMMQAAMGLKNESIPVEERVKFLGELSLTEENFDLLLDIVQIGVSRGTKDFTRESMEELVIELPELMAALPVILAQTGMAPAPGGGGTPVGEATPPEAPSM